jgi:membrane protein YdbS with pleckstrin-like domain
MRTPLQKGEKILLVTRTAALTLIVPAIIALAGLVAAWFIPVAWGKLAAALLGIFIFLYKYFRWKVDIWVVTNYRVIDEAGLLSHFAKESPLEKINNVSYDQSLWGRLFNYGHVEIQTAAQVGATDYYNVFHPKRLKDTITLAQSDYKSQQFASQALQMAAALPKSAFRQGEGQAAISHSMADELQKLHDLRQKGIISEEEYARAKSKLLG